MKRVLVVCPSQGPSRRQRMLIEAMDGAGYNVEICRGLQRERPAKVWFNEMPHIDPDGERAREAMDRLKLSE